jgi:hypothetical protein
MGFAKRTLILFFVLFMAAFAQQVQAVLRELPNSSHYQGSVNYNTTVSGGVLSGRIDFAVYDRDDDEFPTPPGSSKYIYAYQIFNDEEESDQALAYFAIFGAGEYSMDVDTGSITSQIDPAPVGVQPSSQSFTASNKRAVWNFGGGSLVKDEHSWLLVFSSNRDWVAGTYEMKTADQLPPVPPIAEPGTMALICGGSLLLARRKKTR